MLNRLGSLSNYDEDDDADADANAENSVDLKMTFYFIYESCDPFLKVI